MNRTPGPSHPKGILFIVGFPRSGTTMLRTVLSRHPGLNVYASEPHYVFDLHRIHGATIRNTHAAADLMERSNYTGEDRPAMPLRDALPSGVIALRDFLLLYFSLLFDDFRDRVLVLKLPAMAKRLDLLAALFPEARVLNIVRDPRAAVASHKTRWPEGLFMARVMEWRACVRAPDAWAGREGRHTVTLRYEDLLEEPETTLRRLCSKAQIPFSEELMDVDYVLPQWKPENPGKPTFTHFQGFDTAKIEQWRDVLSAEEVRLIESVCRREMAAYGYEPSNPPVNTPRYGLFRARQSLLNAARRARRFRK